MLDRDDWVEYWARFGGAVAFYLFMLLAPAAGIALLVGVGNWASNRLFGSGVPFFIAVGVLLASYLAWIFLDNGHHVSLWHPRKER